MKIGTKSVLFGVHCFVIHPLIVAWAWFTLYGFRRVRDAYVTTSLLDPRLWAAFIVHDLGYVGKPNMDGPEGETHPEWGAWLLGELFGGAWYNFSRFHSRYLAKRAGMAPSALCMADKRAIVVEPTWLYLPRARATGELAEFLAAVKSYMRRWIAAHRDGAEDAWTRVRHLDAAGQVAERLEATP